MWPRTQISQPPRPELLISSSGLSTATLLEYPEIDSSDLLLFIYFYMDATSCQFHPGPELLVSNSNTIVLVQMHRRYDSGRGARIFWHTDAPNKTQIYVSSLWHTDTLIQVRAYKHVDPHWETQIYWSSLEHTDTLMFVEDTCIRIVRHRHTDLRLRVQTHWSML